MNNYCSNNMCYRNYQIPKNSNNEYYRESIMPNSYQMNAYQTNPSPNFNTNNNGFVQEDDRFFFAPFLVGGLAGTALGYGIANNNQIKNGGYYMPPPPIYYYPAPTPYTYNNYYY